MCSCEKDCRIKAAFIILMLYAASIFIMSILQLCNEGDYGYKNIITNLKYYTSGQYLRVCNRYLSEINFKRKFAETKTIFNLLYNLYLFIYGMQRLKKEEGNCKLGVVFSLIVFFGNVTELVLTSISLDYYNSFEEEKRDINKCNKNSKSSYYSYSDNDDDNYSETRRIIVDISYWVIELDISIISLTAASVFPIFYLLYQLLCKDCDSYDCVEKEFFWLCSSIKDCSKECCGLCGIFCKGCDKCCEICNGNDDSGLKGENDKLTVKNNELRITLANLENELSDLRKQKNVGENNIKSAREKHEKEKQQYKNKLDQDLKNEQNLNEGINKLKMGNANLKNDIEKLKKRNKKVGNDLEIMEDKFISENKEMKQLSVIQYYANKKYPSANNDKNKLIKDVVSKELEKLRDGYGINIDSNKFNEKCLYYVTKKLTENLKDSKTNDIFSKPVITQDGKTFEGKNLSKSKNHIENKLVSELCKILKENEGDLTFDNFQKIKKLLISKETGKYYKNPVVIISGENKGETIEDIDNENNGYKNIIIKNIIGDIRELLDDDFFKFEISDNNEITTNDNNFNGFNIIGFGDV